MRIRDLRAGGYFIEHYKDLKGRPRTAEFKNTVVSTGASWMLRDIFRGETTLLPATWYLGLTGATYSFDTATLASLAALEPAGNGYARQAINRNTTDWTVSEVNSVMQALSKLVTFTASANWDKTWQRMFLCDAASGTAGNVISVSGPAPAARTVLSGQGPGIQYTFYLRG